LYSEYDDDNDDDDGGPSMVHGVDGDTRILKTNDFTLQPICHCSTFHLIDSNIIIYYLLLKPAGNQTVPTH